MCELVWVLLVVEITQRLAHGVLGGAQVSTRKLDPRSGACLAQEPVPVVLWRDRSRPCQLRLGLLQAALHGQRVCQVGQARTQIGSKTFAFVEGAQLPREFLAAIEIRCK